MSKASSKQERKKEQKNLLLGYQPGVQLSIFFLLRLTPELDDYVILILVLVRVSSFVQFWSLKQERGK